MSETPQTRPPGPDAEAAEAAFAGALDDLLSAWAANRTVSVEEMLALRPDLAGRVEEVFDLAREIAVVRPPPQPRVPGYEILEEAGRGGMGIVYRARQSGVERLVALKVVSGSVDDERIRQRFLTEARALGRVRHENIVTIFEVIDLPDLCAYAMEWIEGRSLADLLEQRLTAGAARNAPLDFEGPSNARLRVEPVTWMCRTGIAVGRALAVLHRHGLMHRDVKPANVLLRRDGTPLLSDFGLVHDEALGLTRTGQFLGTAAYAPPEQLRGEIRSLAPTVDVYGLGATLHCALAGQPPYSGRTPTELLAAIESRRRQPLTQFGLPTDLETIVGKCLEADPKDRYPDTTAVADELERLLSLRPIQARPLGLAARLWRMARRNRRLLVTSSAVGLLVFAGSAVLAWWLFQRLTLADRLEQALFEARIQVLDPTHTERVILADRSPAAPGAVHAGSRPSPLVATAQAALAAYARVVGMDPGATSIRIEAEVVDVALALLQQRYLPQSPVLADEAPATWAAARAWSREPDASPRLPDAAADRRALGLLAFLTGRAGACHAAWEGLALAGDPFIDAASAQMLVTRGDLARAYPRFARATAAWPQAGFLAVGMARCAIAAGDLQVARDQIARAQRLDYLDPFNTLRAVRGELHAAEGRWDEARAEFEWMLEHHRAIEVRVAYARMLDRLGDLRLACELLLQAAEMEPEGELRRYLPQAAATWCRYWDGLDASSRLRAVEWDWQQGYRGLALRLARLLRAAKPEVRAAAVGADAVVTQRTPAIDRGSYSRSMVALWWIDDAAGRVTWLPPTWRRIHAAWVVVWSADPLLALGRARPWVTTVAGLASRVGLGISQRVRQVIARHDSARIEWQRVTLQPAPSRRVPFGFCGDDRSGTVVMYGGHAGVTAPPLADAWAFVDGRWALLSPGVGPGARYNGAIASDGVGFLAFGGLVANRLLAGNETWRLVEEGPTWRWRCVAAAGNNQPEARSSHAMAYDRDRGTVVLFGGQNASGISRNDTWEWSAATTQWRCRVSGRPASSSPSPPSLGACMVYDERHKVMILVGGLHRGPAQIHWPRSMWAWDGEAWQRFPDSIELPPDRIGAGFIHHRQRGTCLLHGGASSVGVALSDTWEWDGIRWRLLDTGTTRERPWRGIASPGLASLESGEVLLFGGSANDGSEPFDETWRGRVVAR